MLKFEYSNFSIRISGRLYARFLGVNFYEIETFKPKNDYDCSQILHFLTGKLCSEK